MQAVADREYAYFCAVGAFDPTDITNAIGLDPSESWATGEGFFARGHAFRRAQSRWKLNSGLDDTHPLNQHVRSLLDALSPYREGLLHAATMARLQIACVGYYQQSFGWELDFELQKLATALSIGFCFDMYSFGDHHEEIVALREQVCVRSQRP
ncbi:hypothetical protein LPJGGPFB_02901 [Ensifer adhaerens]|uniref:Uncharacterized protein n=1 Tax=Ensifer adhaerens TaxID=106592 RepID=A0ACC5SYA2_ENSAD|nr:DUF4279 domain-containing protein [Ensifer adhaerens]MBP1873871.1 hypothetical protein [Ensifer adhaerens]NRP19644.1 hypothetical protein [Ensifer adhaerens]